MNRPQSFFSLSRSRVSWVTAMRLLWIISFWLLQLDFTKSQVEDNGAYHENERKSKYNVDSPPSPMDSRRKGDASVLRNRRKNNVHGRRFLEAVEPLTKTNFEKDEIVRLESDFVADPSPLGVWFQVRQDGSRFRSYSAKEGSQSRYYVEIDHLVPGKYYWRVSVRKSGEYDLSPEYSFTVDGTYDDLEFVTNKVQHSANLNTLQASRQPRCHQRPQCPPTAQYHRRPCLQSLRNQPWFQ